MKVNKTPHPITPEKKDTNELEKRPYKMIDQIRCGYSMKMRPISEAFIRDLATKAIDDARNDPDILSIESICHKHGITRTTFDNWVSKFPFMAEAKQFIINAFATRLENGVFKGKEGIREKGAMHILPMYSKTWKTREAEIIELSKGEDESKINITVVKEAAPSSDLVPTRTERKKDVI